MIWIKCVFTYHYLYEYHITQLPGFQSLLLSIFSAFLLIHLELQNIHPQAHAHFHSHKETLCIMEYDIEIQFEQEADLQNPQGMELV